MGLGEDVQQWGQELLGTTEDCHILTTARGKLVERGIHPLELKPRNTPLSRKGLQLQASLGSSLQCPVWCACLSREAERKFSIVPGGGCEPYTSPECW